MKKNQKKNFASGCWVHPTTHPDNAGLAVRGPTHTDQIGPIRCPKWVGPLEMPLIYHEVHKKIQADGIECLLNVLLEF
jgi:hypothetical protein